MKQPTLEQARGALLAAMQPSSRHIAPELLINDTLDVMKERVKPWLLVQRSDKYDEWFREAKKQVLAAAAEFRDMLRRL